jgi:hypothetical protein
MEALKNVKPWLTVVDTFCIMVWFDQHSFTIVGARRYATTTHGIWRTYHNQPYHYLIESDRDWDTTNGGSNNNIGGEVDTAQKNIYPFRVVLPVSPKDVPSRCDHTHLQQDLLNWFVRAGSYVNFH